MQNVLEESMTNKPQIFFTKTQSLINIAAILDYFNLEEVLKLSKLNSLIFRYIKSTKCTSQLLAMKKTYLAVPILNLPNIELILNKILKEDKYNKEKNIILEFFAIYVFKYIFRRQIHFHQQKNDTIVDLMKFYEDSTFTYDLNMFQFTENRLNLQSMNFILNTFLSVKPISNLMNITISNSQLTDDSLEPIQEYLNKFSSVKTLILDENQIGLTDKSLHFLENIKNNSNLEWVSFDSCYFSSNCLNILKEIYHSDQNKIKSLTMYFNMFSKKDIVRFFDLEYVRSDHNFYDFSIMNKNYFNKNFGISFKYSPDYNIRNCLREVKFGSNFISNRYDDTDFYEIYIKELNFDALNLVKVDFNIQYIIEKIIMNVTLKEVEINVNTISDYLCHIIFMYWKKDCEGEARNFKMSQEKINYMQNKFCKNREEPKVDRTNVNEIIIERFVLK